jgi:hypothetical protein
MSPLTETPELRCSRLHRRHEEMDMWDLERGLWTLMAPSMGFFQGQLIREPTRP